MRALLTFTILLVACGSGGSGSSQTTSTGTAGTSELDGTWDVTQLGGRTLAASSQMTITNGRATGKLEYVGSGQGGTGCEVDKDAIEFDVAFAGDDATGTITRKASYVGSGCGASSSSMNRTYTLQGGRAKTASGIDGEWDVNFDRSSFMLLIEGLKAKAGSKSKVVTDPDVSITVANGLATATSKTKSYTFAARRR